MVLNTFIYYFVFQMRNTNIFAENITHFMQNKRFLTYYYNMRCNKIIKRYCIQKRIKEIIRTIKITPKYYRLICMVSTLSSYA